MSACKDQDPRIHAIQSRIRVVPNFPKPGIMFQDITTLLLDPKAFKDTIDLFVERYKDKSISVVAGIEARGFIFGPPIALAIGAKFVPLRKPNKLPGKVFKQEYDLEYGSDCLEMHIEAVEAGERALVVDDLIATGGTVSAAMNLLEHVHMLRNTQLNNAIALEQDIARQFSIGSKRGFSCLIPGWGKSVLAQKWLNVHV